MDLSIGRAKLVYKYLGFLSEQYNMQCDFQILENTSGIENPTYIYTFYNKYGCFTIKDPVQTGECDCYIAMRYEQNQLNLLSKKIDQHIYLGRNVFFFRTFLKLVAKAIFTQIKDSNSFWGIPLSEQ